VLVAGSIVNDDAEVSKVPLTITSTCLAVTVALVFAQVQPVPDLATKRNSKVLVIVRPGALPRVGGSVRVTVRLPPPGQGITRLFQGIQIMLVGKLVNMLVQVLAG